MSTRDDDILDFDFFDEEDSPFTRLIRGALGGDEAGKHLDAQVVSRAEAMRRIGANDVAAPDQIEHLQRRHRRDRKAALDALQRAQQSRRVTDGMVGRLVVAP